MFTMCCVFPCKYTEIKILLDQSYQFLGPQMEATDKLVKFLKLGDLYKLI